LVALDQHLQWLSEKNNILLALLHQCFQNQSCDFLFEE